MRPIGTRLVGTRRTETASGWTRLIGSRLTESRLVGMTPFPLSCMNTGQVLVVYTFRGKLASIIYDAAILPYIIIYTYS